MGTTVLCDVCRVTIEFEFSRMKWFDFHGCTDSVKPYPHQHFNRYEDHKGK